MKKFINSAGVIIFLFLSGVLIFYNQNSVITTDPVDSSNGREVSNRQRRQTSPLDKFDRAALQAKSFSAKKLKESGFGFGWEDALELGLSLKGSERNAFLMNYLDEFSQEEDFDRVGFFTKLREIKGPGGDFLAMLTNVYSRPTGISGVQFLDELSRFELSKMEYEMVLTSGGGVFNEQFIQEDLEVVLKKGPPEAVVDLMIQIHASRLSKDPGELSADGIIASLHELGMEQKHKRGVIYNLVRTSPESWWDHFQSFASEAEVTSGPSSEFFEENIPLWAASFLNHKTSVELLEFSAKGGRGSGDLAKVASARWAAQDTAELATWVNQQPAGPVKDSAITSLVQSLVQNNLREDAGLWVDQISDAQMRAAMQSNLPKD